MAGVWHYQQEHERKCLEELGPALNEAKAIAQSFASLAKQIEGQVRSLENRIKQAETLCSQAWWSMGEEVKRRKKETEGADSDDQ